MTGEQLERTSYDKPNTTAECSVCGVRFDVEQDTHGVSIDGEAYCCGDCLKDCARSGVIKMNATTYRPVEYFAHAICTVNGKTEEVTTDVYPVEYAALKRAAEMAETLWQVKSWIERN